jgi:hypothetical protein
MPGHIFAGCVNLPTILSAATIFVNVVSIGVTVAQLKRE